MLTSLLILPIVALAPMDSLKTRLDGICKGLHGRMGYSIKELKTGRHISFRGDERFPTASTIKTAIALEAIHQVETGKLQWSSKRMLPNAAQRVPYDASMWAYHMKDGVSLDLDGYTNLMITVSDNLATRVLREWLGTLNIDANLESLGFKDTKCLSSAPPEATRLRKLNGQFGMGMTTPNEMNRLLELIYLRKAASPAGCEKLLRIMSHQYWDDWIGSTVPTNVRLSSKSGAIDRSRSDTAIVFAENPYIITIYTDGQKDQRYASDNEGELALLKIADIVWNTLEPKKPYHLPPGYQKFTPTGGGVEDS